jgi:hypothetical protein
MKNQNREEATVIESQISQHVQYLFSQNRNVEAAMLDMACFECSSFEELKKLRDSIIVN